jgi:fructose-1-phosphate kinase PfkB-like protein
MNQIRTNSTVKSGIDEETGEVKTPGASVESNKLKQMLAGLKSKTE